MAAKSAVTVDKDERIPPRERLLTVAGELFYRQGDRMMSVACETAAGFRSGGPVELFQGSFTGFLGRFYDVSPDGSRFLMVRDVTASAPGSSSARIVLVQGFAEEVKRLVPVN